MNCLTQLSEVDVGKIEKLFAAKDAKSAKKSFFVYVFVGQNKALPFLALLIMFDERQQRYRLYWSTKKAEKYFTFFFALIASFAAKN